MAQSLLKTQKLSKYSWDEAIACSVYILNRLPNSSVQIFVPEEAWSGKKVTISHFHVFGCIAFTHVPEKLRKNLDDRSEKYIFIGYSDQSKAYRLFNPITKKFVVSQDVKFLEDKSWNEMENNTCPNPFILLYEHQAPATSTPRLQVEDKTSSS